MPWCGNRPAGDTGVFYVPKHEVCILLRFAMTAMTRGISYVEDSDDFHDMKYRICSRHW